jgi:exodeoxyribonuclease-5
MAYNNCTAEQKELLHVLEEWFDAVTRGRSNKMTFSFVGPAGSGKTYMINEIIRYLKLGYEEYTTCAYTGKAAQNLMKHRLKSRTIHSLIYELVPEEIDDPLTGNVTIKKIFRLRDELEDPKLKLIICDESSMVNDEMVAQMLTFHIPLVFVGDMNQLPPIQGISTAILKPDFILKNIMRQVADNPIIMLSQKIINGEKLVPGQYGSSTIRRKQPAINYAELFEGYDIVACCTNEIRDTVNDGIRLYRYGVSSRDPQEEDKVICRKNNWEVCIGGTYLTNGLSGIIERVNTDDSRPSYYNLDLILGPNEIPFYNVKVDRKFLSGFGSRRILDNDNIWSYYELFEYAYALTTHLLQGDQKNRVFYFDKVHWDPDYNRRMRYTAITRAIDFITIELEN